MSSKITDNTDIWICPYPDPDGNYPRCDYRGGIPTVEPSSSRNATCLPCKVGKIVHQLLNLSGLIKVFNELAKSTL